MFKNLFEVSFSNIGIFLCKCICIIVNHYLQFYYKHFYFDLNQMDAAIMQPDLGLLLCSYSFDMFTVYAFGVFI